MSVLVGNSSKSKIPIPSSLTNRETGGLSMGTSKDIQPSGHDAEGRDVDGNTVDDVASALQGGHQNGVYLDRQFSKRSECESENEEDFEQEQQEAKSFLVSPIVALKEQLDKDKDDDSLARWKEQLLGNVVLDHGEGEESLNPHVQVLSFSIISNGRPNIVIPLPLPTTQKVHLFTLKEGSTYRIKFTFIVRCNIVSGLTYIHTIWKNGFRVDNTKIMLGTFGPQMDPYTHIMDEEMTPSGILARGSYTSRIRFVDDDGRNHLEIQHTFGISKDW